MSGIQGEGPRPPRMIHGEGPRFETETSGQPSEVSESQSRVNLGFLGKGAAELIKKIFVIVARAFGFNPSTSSTGPASQTAVTVKPELALRIRQKAGYDFRMSPNDSPSTKAYKELAWEGEALVSDIIEKGMDTVDKNKAAAYIKSFSTKVDNLLSALKENPPSEEFKTSIRDLLADSKGILDVIKKSNLGKSLTTELKSLDDKLNELSNKVQGKQEIDSAFLKKNYREKQAKTEDLIDKTEMKINEELAKPNEERNLGEISKLKIQILNLKIQDYYDLAGSYSTRASDAQMRSIKENIERLEEEKSKLTKFLYLITETPLQRNDLQGFTSLVNSFIFEADGLEDSAKNVIKRVGHDNRDIFFEILVGEGINRDDLTGRVSDENIHTALEALRNEKFTMPPDMAMKFIKNPEVGHRIKESLAFVVLEDLLTKANSTNDEATSKALERLKAQNLLPSKTMAGRFLKEREDKPAADPFGPKVTAFLIEQINKPIVR
jgi:hypothetical protein